MAEIKSSLEIALKRAADIAGRDDSDAELIEAGQTGQLLARKILGGALPAHDLGRELNKLSQRARPAARKTAAKGLLEKLPDSWFLVGPALEVLADDAGQGGLIGQLGHAVGALEEARSKAEKSLAHELTMQCEKLGICGSAVSPNPKAHPDYEPRTQTALREAALKLDALIDQLANLL